MKHKLTVERPVDRPTQDALIKATESTRPTSVDPERLLISGQGLMVGGKNIVADGSWGPHTEQP